MIIDQKLCIQCKLCVPYCPMGAIVAKDSKVYIDQDECVECEVCRNAKVCKQDALVMEELSWPRSLRRDFSNPLVPHSSTSVPGRGTEEMKTNDVTGRFKLGRVGVALEMGRPGVGTLLGEVERVAMACAKHGVNFEPLNPVAAIMEDVGTGKLKDEVLGEKVLSAIIEFELPVEKVSALFEDLKEVSKQIDTVFSADYAYKVNPKDPDSTINYLKEAGIFVSPNGKTNVGLGRPLAKEVD